MVVETFVVVGIVFVIMKVLVIVVVVVDVLGVIVGIVVLWKSPLPVWCVCFIICVVVLL